MLSANEESFAACLLVVGMPPFKQSYDAHYDDYYGEEQFQYHDTDWQLKVCEFAGLDNRVIRLTWLKEFVSWLVKKENRDALNR